MSGQPRGVRLRDERLLRNFKRDPRRIAQLLADSWRTPEGAAFSCALMGFATLLQPGLVYLIPLAVLVLLTVHLPDKRHRHLPMRLPIEAGMPDYNDPKPQHKGWNKARGMIFVGNSIDDDGEELWQSRADELAHGLVLGTTGAGKTVQLVGQTGNYIAIGGGSVYIDAKASPSLFWEIGAIAFRCGREDDLQVINYMTGNRTSTALSPVRTSNTTNPFVAGNADACKEMLSSLIKEPDGQNAVFGERALAMVGALMYALVALRDAGHCDIGVATIRDHLPIDAFEKLAYDPRIEYRAVARDAIRAYLKSLPGYRPPSERIQRNRQGLPVLNEDGTPALEPHIEQVHNQHGFAQMYFTRAMSSLTDTYGHIYQGSLPEVDYQDTALRRRILIVMLPALEKSPAELSNLGKINLASLRDAIKVGLGSGIEGQRRNVLDNLPTDSPIASQITCDEYGYMAVDGFSVVAAQARSLGFTVTWAGQDWAGIKRGSEKEAEQIWSNATLKKFGRLEDYESFQKLQQQAGEASIVQSRGYSSDADSLSGYRETGDLGIEKRQRVDFGDLQMQVEGESHIMWRGRLIRARNFGVFLPELKSIQVNRYLRVGERVLKLDDEPTTANTTESTRVGGGGMSAQPAPPVPLTPKAPPAPPAAVTHEELRPLGRATGRLSQAGARNALAVHTEPEPAAAVEAASSLAAFEDALANEDTAFAPAPAVAPVEPVDADLSLEELLGLPDWDAPTGEAVSPAALPEPPSAAQTEHTSGYEIEDMPDVIDLSGLIAGDTPGAAALNDHVKAAIESYPDELLLKDTASLSPEEIAEELERKMRFLLEGDGDDSASFGAY